MKKLLLLTALCTAAVPLMTSCVVSGCDNLFAEERLPLSSHKLNLTGEFTEVVNNTVIDIEFTQGADVSAELACPEDLTSFVIFSIADNVLTLKISDKLSDSERNTVNRGLVYSKLFLTAPHLTGVTVNGSSAFSVSGDLRADDLKARLNGSGDIDFSGVQCSTLSAVLNGSGDMEFNREVKAKAVTMQVNGSGDLNCAILTAGSAAASLNGSGDMVLNAVLVEDVDFRLNGSGDLEAHSITAGKVDASLTGSGDIKLSGSCDRAILTLNNSGDLSARKLQARDVTATVIGSGEIICNAQNTLTAKVSGSGSIRYKGDPQLTCLSKPDNIERF